MTTVTTHRPNGTVRRRVGWSDLIWLTWRQHRWLIAITSLVVLAFSGLMVWSSARLGDLAAAQCGGVCSGNYEGPVPLYDERKSGENMIAAVSAFACLIALFWAAPLLSREYEQRTHLLAWSQDVTPVRWFLGKVVPMGLVAVCLALVLGASAADLGDEIQRVRPESYWRFNPLPFEAFAPVQAGYALFGFALGLLISALVRRTLLAMGTTLALFFATRALIANEVRPYYQTPVHQVMPQHDWQTLPDALSLGTGYLDAAGNEVDTMSCQLSGQEFDSCVRGTTFFYDYQPAERLTTFRLIETAIFTALGGVLFVLAWLRVRRA